MVDLRGQGFELRQDGDRSIVIITEHTPRKMGWLWLGLAGFFALSAVRNAYLGDFVAAAVALVVFAVPMLVARHFLSIAKPSTLTLTLSDNTLERIRPGSQTLTWPRADIVDVASIPPNQAVVGDAPAKSDLVHRWGVGFRHGESRIVLSSRLSEPQARSISDVIRDWSVRSLTKAA
jgi:hypothetical protein